MLNCKVAVHSGIDCSIYALVSYTISVSACIYCPLFATVVVLHVNEANRRGSKVSDGCLPELGVGFVKRLGHGAVSAICIYIKTALPV